MAFSLPPARPRPISTEQLIFFFWMSELITISTLKVSRLRTLPSLAGQWLSQAYWCHIRCHCHNRLRTLPHSLDLEVIWKVTQCFTLTIITKHSQSEIAGISYQTYNSAPKDIDKFQKHSKNVKILQMYTNILNLCTII